MANHVKTLGYLHIALGSLGILAAVALVMIFGGIAGILRLVHDPDAEMAIPIVGIVLLCIAAFLVIVSLPGIIAGFGLLNFQQWARILAIVIGAFNLLNFPLGTFLAAYTFYVLLSPQTEVLFSPRQGYLSGPRAAA